MSQLETNIIIDRPPAAVFAGLTNFSKWPLWQGGLISADQISPGPLQIGSQLRQIRSSGKPKESLIEVTRLVPNQMLGVKSPSPPLAWQGMFTLEPLDMSTRFGLEFEIQARRRSNHMKILFAAMPADGHFNPLTGVAMHLKAAGHDVRWYAAPSYIPRLERLGIPYFPFIRATEINASNIGELFPERAKLRGPALIRFDGNHFFVADVGNHFEDVRDINASFAFDVLFCDAGFYAMKLIKEKLGKRVCAIGVGPSLETSKDVPPNFAGLKPAKNALGRLAHQGMRAMMERMVMNDLKANYNRMLAAQGLAPIDGSLFDISYRSPDVLFQSGVPGFAYPRRESNPKVKFVGALLPYKATIATVFSQPEKLDKYKPVILISQGTFEKDGSKLIVPALEALKDTGALLIVTTGYGRTEELRKSYPQDNVIIEDFVDFDYILDHTDLFICNGGYGSVLLSLSKGIPVLGAGTQEGKNDVNAHVDYFGVGINLHTERPKSADIRRAAERILSKPRWKQNVARLRDELSRYHPNELIDAYLFNGKGRG